MPDTNVRFQGQTGKHLLMLSFSQFDPLPDIDGVSDAGKPPG